MSAMPAFTPQQDAALNAVAKWLKSKPGRGNTPQVFRLFGYAGTGKTTLARALARSLSTATEWWQKAAEQGHTEAQVELATQYFLGRGAPKDWKLAARWYEAAAANGDAAAQYIIGSFYEHGDGVARDLRKALAWYVLAARQGDVGAAAQAKDVARRLSESAPSGSAP